MADDKDLVVDLEPDGDEPPRKLQGEPSPDSTIDLAQSADELAIAASDERLPVPPAIAASPEPEPRLGTSTEDAEALLDFLHDAETVQSTEDVPDDELRRIVAERDGAAADAPPPSVVNAPPARVPGPESPPPRTQGNRPQVIAPSPLPHREVQDVGIEIVIEPDVVPAGTIDFMRYPVSGHAPAPLPAAPAPAPVPAPAVAAVAATTPTPAPRPYGGEEWREGEADFSGSAAGAVWTMVKAVGVIAGFVIGFVLLLYWLNNNATVSTSGENVAGKNGKTGGPTVRVENPDQPDATPEPEPELLPEPIFEPATAPTVIPAGPKLAGMPKNEPTVSAETQTPAPEDDEEPEVTPSKPIELELDPAQKRQRTRLLMGGPLAAAALAPKPKTGPLPPTQPGLTLEFTEEYDDPAKPAEIARLRAEAERLEGEGDLEGALGLYEKLLALDPHDAGALFAAGLVNHLLDRPDVAFTLYRRNLAQRHSTNVRALNNIGLIYAAGEDGETKARLAYEEAIRRQPGFAQALTNLGSLQLDEGDPKGAKIYYERALQNDPGLHIARLNLARALTDLGALDRAEAELRRVLDAPGEQLEPEAHEALGRIAATREQHEKAVAAYRAALEKSPGFTLARNNLGVSLIALGNADEAVVELRQCSAETPGDAKVWTNLGHALTALGRLQTAKEAYEKALEIDENLIEARYNYAILAERFGNFPFAIYEYEEIVKADPQHARAWNNLGVLYRRAGLKLIDDDSDASGGGGADARDLMDKSIKRFEKAIDVDPRLLEPRINIIASLWDADRRVEARQALDRVGRFIQSTGAAVSADQLQTLKTIKERIEGGQSPAAPPGNNIPGSDVPIESSRPR